MEINAYDSENIIEHTSSLNPQIQVQKYKIER